ncbi:MAG: DUF5946 family protein [Vicinamibacterales bacterium]
MTAFDELCAYTLTLHDTTFIHQHVVDAQAVQDADARTKPIKLTFGLVGLCLHLEHGFTGREVQRAHMMLARTKHPWPTWPLPAGRGALSAADVLARPPGEARRRAIDEWCRSAWQAYADSHDAVAALLARHRIVPPPEA